jgi:fibronectin-binding autotransporter adhesin
MMRTRTSAFANWAATVALVSLVVTSARAQTDFFWNAPNGGIGPWDTTTQNWSTLAAGPVDYTWLSNGNERANFGNTAGTVTIPAGGVNAFGVNFNVDGYVIAGGTLTLQGVGGPVVAGSGFTGTINTPIAGTQGLTKTGAGIVILGGANTYSGTTTVSAGTLRLGASDRIANKSPLVLTASTATFDLNNFNQTVPSLAASVAATVSLGTGTLTVGGDNTSTTFTGLFTGAGTVNKVGTGTLTLRGSGTWTGPLNVSGGGAVSIDSSLRLGPAAAAGTVTLNGGTLIQTNPGNAGSFIGAARGIAIDSTNGGTVDYSPSGTDRSFTAIYQPTTATISGPGTLTKTGFGEFRYQNAGTALSTFTKLVVNQGLFRLGSVTGQNFETGFGAVPGSFLPDAITLNGGSIGTSFTVTLDANRGITLGPNGGTFNNSAAPMTVPGVITGSGSLNKGTGTLTLANANNNYTGSTTIAGTLSVAALADGGSNSAIGASSSAASNLVLNGGSLQFTGPAVSTNRLFSVTSAGGTLDASGTGPVTYANTGANLATDKAPTAFTVNSGNTFVFLGTTGTAADLAGLAVGMPVSGAGIPAGATVSAISATLAQFTLSVAPTASAADTPLTFGSLDRVLTLTGTNTGANTVAGTLANSPTKVLGVNKFGTGTWALTGANTYTGPTALARGILSVATLADGGAASNIGQASNAAGNLLLSSGTLQYTGPAVSTNRLFSITSAGGTLDASGAGPVTFTNTGANLSTDKAATTFTLANSSTTVTIAPGGTTSDLVGLAAGMTVSGTGIAANTTVSAVTTTGFTLSTATTATAAGSPSLTFGSVNRTLTLTGTNTGANAISGTLANSPTTTLAVAKTGAGTWVLNGANTYTGGTTVSAGTLIIGSTAGGGASVAGNVTGSGTGTLGGHGTVGGNVTLPTGTTLSPGASVGTLSVGGTATLGGTYLWEISTAGPSDPTFSGGSTPGGLQSNHDALAVTGALDLTGSTLNLVSLGTTGFNNTQPYSWKIATASAITSLPTLGTVAGPDFGNLGGGAFSLAAGGGGSVLLLNFTPVPEPVHCLLIAGGACGLFRVVRRRAVRRADG